MKGVQDRDNHSRTNLPEFSAVHSDLLHYTDRLVPGPYMSSASYLKPPVELESTSGGEIGVCLIRV